MDGRGNLLTMCHYRHYEFSSLRRAEFSTLCLLHELHKNGNLEHFPIFEDYPINLENSEVQEDSDEISSNQGVKILQVVSATNVRKKVLDEVKK